MSNIFSFLYYSFTFCFLSTCSQSVESIDIRVPSIETITLSNYSSNEYFIPISRIDSTLPVVSQSQYEVDNCKVINTESISSELVMFTFLDTLMSGETKKYKLNLFNSDVSMRYDSQLIYKLEIYNGKDISPSLYAAESAEKILLISYRDAKGKLYVSPFVDEKLPSCP